MINIYSIQEHLESHGWGLESDTYKNLTTPIKIICPKGHKQEQAYGNWRKHKTCEQCLAGDTTKVKKNNVPKKKMNIRRILALDAATNISGYSIYDDDVLVSFGTYKASQDKTSPERINEIKHWLERRLEEWKPDFVGVENIQMQHNVEMFKVLANLQGVLIDTLIENEVKHSLVYSSEWRKTCGIVGGERENKKKQAQDKVFNWYNVKCNQDEADAICIGKHFVKTEKNKNNDMKEGFWR